VEKTTECTADVTATEMPLNSRCLVCSNAMEGFYGNLPACARYSLSLDNVICCDSWHGSDCLNVMAMDVIMGDPIWSSPG